MHKESRSLVLEIVAPPVPLYYVAEALYESMFDVLLSFYTVLLFACYFDFAATSWTEDTDEEDTEQDEHLVDPRTTDTIDDPNPYRAPRSY